MNDGTFLQTNEEEKGDDLWLKPLYRKAPGLEHSTYHAQERTQDRGMNR